MESRENPFESPTRNIHHQDGQSNYPYKSNRRKKVRLGYEPWPLNILGTMLVWWSRSLGCLMLYYFIYTNAREGQSLLDIVMESWKSGHIYLIFVMTSIFFIPILMLFWVAQDSLMRTKFFTLPEDPEPPPRKWWHWFMGM